MKIKRPARNTNFSVPCTEEEKEDVARKAAEMDMTVSAYVRWVLKNYSKADNRKKKEAGQNG